MPSNLPVIKVRTNEDVIEKFRIIAKSNSRSMSKEAEHLILKHIREFENRYNEKEVKI